MAQIKITTNSLTDDAVTSAKIGVDVIAAEDLAANSITASEISSNAVTTAKIIADAVTGAKIADDQVDSEHLAAGGIDTEHLGNLQVTTAKIAADAIDATKLADDVVDSEHLAAGGIDTEHIAASQVTTAKIAASNITNALMADDAIDSAEIAAGAIDTAHIADDQITLAKMAGITRGQIIYGNASGNPTALAIGTSGYALTSDGNDISWGSVSETKPTISSISPSVITNAATNVTITGTNFVNTPLVEVINSSGVITLPNSVSFTNATTIVVNLTLGTDATYFLRVENNDGNAVRSSTALLTVSDEPAWTTAAGSLGSFSGASTIGTINLTATNSTGMAVQSGSLPGGISLNSASGTSTLTGTESGASSDTTYNFTIRATDAEAQYVDRAFSLSFTFAINNSIRFGG